jgi:hypothetical protein
MIAEIITTDGEVISSTEENFFIKVLNQVPHEELKDYFLKKEMLLKIRENHKKSNGSCGINQIQLKNIVSFEELEKTLNYLQEKKQITKREGVNHEMYFLNTKNK